MNDIMRFARRHWREILLVTLDLATIAYLIKFDRAAFMEQTSAYLSFYLFLPSFLMTVATINVLVLTRGSDAPAEPYLSTMLVGATLMALLIAVEFSVVF